MMKSVMLRMFAVTLSLALCLAPVAWAQEESSGTTASEVGVGVASFLVSVPYGAAKVGTALVGGIVGGFTYVLSGFDKKAAQAVWYTTIGGDYIVTPDHLRGKKELRFTGVTPEPTVTGGTSEPAGTSERIN